MNKIAIVTDSSAQLSSDEIKRLGIHVLPLTILIDDKTYIDGENIQKVEFMNLMEKTTNLPKTSQPPLGKFLELYDKLGEDGGEVISIHMTESLSGTVNAARQAAQMTETKVTVIDSNFTDRGLAFQVIEAAKLATNGANEETILNKIEAVKARTSLFICVRTLDNLVKGGRVSRVVGTVSNLMNMKLIFELVDGKLESRVKGRGMKPINKWNQALKETLTQTKNLAEVSFSHAADFDYVNDLKEDFQLVMPDVLMTMDHTGPIIATHTGKGAYAIIYYEKQGI
ncbi:DegV family protein [Carnobacterium funditum]|uniref:DegV family protein n=1 Tax=Carnobacterium funditum TaxID=2752 RepID=UPI0005510F4C|nr:DegV family protein [Carnobacterium funditum]